METRSINSFIHSFTIKSKFLLSLPATITVIAAGDSIFAGDVNVFFCDDHTKLI
jgi:hypothetical protein